MLDVLPGVRWPAQAASALRMSQPERDIVQDYVLSDDLDHLLDDREVSLPFSLSHLPAALAEDVLLEDLWMDVEFDRDDMPDEFCPKSSQSFIDYNFVADCACPHRKRRVARAASRVAALTAESRGIPALAETRELSSPHPLAAPVRARAWQTASTRCGSHSSIATSAARRKRTGRCSISCATTGRRSCGTDVCPRWEHA